MKHTVLLCLLLATACASLRADPESAPAIRIRRDAGRGAWGLEATNARLGDVARALSRSMGCRITVDERCSEQRLDTLITPRAAERLVPVLGRRANVSATLVFRFSKQDGSEVGPFSPAGFGKELIGSDLREPMDLEEALRTLRVPFELADGVRGKVRLSTYRVPVSRVLDQIAAQSGSRWTVLIGLKSRTAADDVAAREEAPRHLFSDLAQLTPDERREEIQADLERLGGLPEDERAESVHSLAANLRGMSTLVREAQENRGAVAGNVATVARDYDLALSRLPSDNRAWSAPLSEALRDLSLDLRSLQ